jgi:hypothetical protein
MDLWASIWGQTSVPFIANESDLAMAFSWQNVSIPAGETQCLSVIFRSGDESGSPPVISVQALGSTSPPVSGSIDVEVAISEASSLVSVFAVVDAHVAWISRVGENLTAGLYTIPINLSPHQLSVGSHLLSFYAVNELGFVSDASNLSLSIKPDPSPTIAQSPTMTSSPLASQTPAPYPSVYPVTCPITWTWARFYVNSFNVYWSSEGGSMIRSTYGSYAIRLRVGNQSADVVLNFPLSISSVTLQPIIVTLSPYTILLISQLTNAAAAPVVCDIAVSGDAVIGDTHNHLIGALPEGQGIYWTGVYNSFEYRINVIGRSYPLVSNISAYWFGYFGYVYDNYWSQTDRPSIWDQDVGFALSWQNISVPSTHRTSLSAMFRSGGHFNEQPGFGDIELDRKSTRLNSSHC